MASHLTNLAALNAIAVKAGGAGGHVRNIGALNEWAVRLGGAGGHTFNLNALNEICARLAAATGHIRMPDALNAISVKLGGVGTYSKNLDALNAIVDLNVGGDTTAPTVTSTNAISLAENTALSHTLTADETVTWTKTGGADAALFTLTGNTLALSARDFELPTDADANNTYIVQVTATDGSGNATAQTITVTVTDVVETVPDETETTALLARMTVQPTSTRKGQINTLIKTLKDGGIWAKLELFYIMASHDAQAARLNWISTTGNASVVVTPAFVTDRGYTGDQATVSYLDTGVVPSTGLTKFSQNSAHMFIWSRTDILVGGVNTFEFGNAPTMYVGRTNAGSGIVCRPSSTSGVVDGTTGFQGLTGWTRVDAANVKVYNNGVLKGGTRANASAAMTTNVLKICANSTTAGAVGGNQLAAAMLGSTLTDSEVAALYSALNTYMTAVGAA